MNIFYFKDINSIGGVESFFWYLAKTYNNIVVYYRNANEKQVKRLSKIVEVHKYNDEIIKCKRFFCCYNPDIINKVEAEEYIHLVHCDYKQVNFSPIMNDKFTKYIGVSQLACDSFTELTGKECELIYNPVNFEIPKVEKYNDGKIHLISATRLTREKGLKRMQKLAKMLEKAHIDYEWVVYTNKQREIIGNNVIYKEPKLDIIEDIAKADFLVQLSDCEAFCYSVVESLVVGTPVICTDLPVFREIGVKKDNAIICDMNMSNIEINDIKKEYKFKYTPPKSDWGKYLDNNSKYNPKDLVKVRTLKRIYLAQENKHLPKNAELEITKERASELECKGIVSCL